MSVYTITMEAQSISTAITILQLTAASDAVVKVTGAWVTQSGSTTSATQRVQLLRKSTAATGTTAVTARPAGIGEVAFGGSAGHTATGEGTDGVVYIAEAFNWLAGWRWTAASDKEALIVPPSGVVAIKFPAAPTSAQTVTAGMIFEEIG
jgi:hypothetical protein